MEAKLLPSSCQITTVRPLERDWRDKAVATQLEMEEVWQALESEREGRYRMIPLSPDSLDNEDDGSGGGGVRVVCISDTHSTHSSIEFRIPDGNIRIPSSLIQPSPPRGYPHTRWRLHQIRPGIRSGSVQRMAGNVTAQSKR